jgi:SnoaL-like protein
VALGAPGRARELKRDAPLGTVPPVDPEGFRRLLETVARAWNEGDTHTALACFTDDARYEPPDGQHYEGRDDLIANWREYQHRSDLDWEAFIALNPF